MNWKSKHNASIRVLIQHSEDIDHYRRIVNMGCRFDCTLSQTTKQPLKYVGEDRKDEKGTHFYFKLMFRIFKVAWEVRAYNGIVASPKCAYGLEVFGSLAEHSGHRLMRLFQISQTVRLRDLTLRVLWIGALHNESKWLRMDSNVVTNLLYLTVIGTTVFCKIRVLPIWYAYLDSFPINTEIINTCRLPGNHRLKLQKMEWFALEHRARHSSEDGVNLQFRKESNSKSRTNWNMEYMPYNQMYCTVI